MIKSRVMNSEMKYSSSVECLIVTVSRSIVRSIRLPSVYSLGKKRRICIALEGIPAHLVENGSMVHDILAHLRASAPVVRRCFVLRSLRGCLKAKHRQTKQLRTQGQSMEQQSMEQQSMEQQSMEELHHQQQQRLQRVRAGWTQRHSQEANRTQP